MAWCDSLFVSLRSDKLGWVSKPYVTHLLDGFSALSDPDHITYPFIDVTDASGLGLIHRTNGKIFVILPKSYKLCHALLHT